MIYYVKHKYEYRVVPLRVVIEEDYAISPIRAVLDPDCPPEAAATWRAYVGEVTDYDAWLDGLRGSLGLLWPSQVTTVRKWRR